MSKKEKRTYAVDMHNPDRIQRMSNTEFLTLTKDLKDGSYYMLLDLHGKEKYQEPHWYLVAKDTKERLGSISSECKWSERPHRVSPEIRKEAEALTREFAPSLEFYFRNGIPDIGDPY